MLSSLSSILSIDFGIVSFRGEGWPVETPEFLADEEAGEFRAFSLGWTVLN